MNRLLISALVPIALAACGSSHFAGTIPGNVGASQGAGDTVAANAVAVKVTGVT